MRRHLASIVLLVASTSCRGSAPPPGLPVEGTTSPPADPPSETASSQASTGATASAASGGVTTSDVAPITTGGAHLEKGVCDALYARAQQTAQSVFKQASACQTAHDCEIVHTGTCGFATGCGSAATLGEGKQVVKSLEEATRKDCDAWVGGGCLAVSPIPIPSCPPVTPACTNGACAAIMK